MAFPIRANAECHSQNAGVSTTQLSDTETAQVRVYGTLPRKPPRGTTPQPPHVTLTNGNGTIGNGIGLNGTPRGILRHRGVAGGPDDYSPIQALYGEHLEMFDGGEDANVTLLPACATVMRQEHAKSSGSVSAYIASYVDQYVRPALAEFLSVVFVTFVVTFLEASMLRLTVQKALQVTLVSMFEGVLFGICLIVFHRVKIQLNPTITLAALFGGLTPPILCLLYWTVQFIGACIGVFVYQVVALEDVHISLPALTLDLSGRNRSWYARVYEFVLCQSITMTFTVLAYLITYESRKPGNPTGVAAAASVTSFVSLLSSSASWNPIRTVAICLVSTLNDIHVSTWNQHYVFWIGPLIGSLVASFFYRLLFADKEKRLRCCRRDAE